MTADEVEHRLGDAIGTLQAGDRPAARALFLALWPDATADPLHASTLAHFMADAQDDPAEELAWDLRALDAALSAPDHVSTYHGTDVSVRAFFPSLYLNLADDYRRLGEVDAARRHLQSGLACLDDLPDTPLGAMTRGGLERLAARVDGNPA